MVSLPLSPSSFCIYLHINVILFIPPPLSDCTPAGGSAYDPPVPAHAPTPPPTPPHARARHLVRAVSLARVPSLAREGGKEDARAPRPAACALGASCAQGWQGCGVARVAGRQNVATPGGSRVAKKRTGSLFESRNHHSHQNIGLGH